jgi:hypothetical protein
MVLTAWVMGPSGVLFYSPRNVAICIYLYLGASKTGGLHRNIDPVRGEKGQRIWGTGCAPIRKTQRMAGF